MTYKPLLIGEAPSKNEDTPQPLEGRVGSRLANLAGLRLDHYMELFERRNLLQVRQDTAAKGFEFDEKAAAIEAVTMRNLYFKDGRVIVLLGKRVAKAFGVKEVYFIQQQYHGPDIRVMPHPSSVNRFWNDLANVKQAEEFMQGIVRRIGV